MIKNIHKFVAKDSPKQSITGVLVTPEKIVATDSFRLVEVTHPFPSVSEPTIVKLPKNCSKIDDISVSQGKVMVVSDGDISIGAIVDDTFPVYDAIFPTEKPMLEIKLNTAYLKEIAEFFERNEQPTFTVKLYGNLKPVLFEAGNIRALLMPIQN